MDPWKSGFLKKGISSAGHASIFGFEMYWIIMAQGPGPSISPLSFRETQTSKQIDGHRDRSEQKTNCGTSWSSCFLLIVIWETQKNCYQSPHLGIFFCTNWGWNFIFPGSRGGGGGGKKWPENLWLVGWIYMNEPLGGGNSNISLEFSPRTLGKWSNLQSYFSSGLVRLYLHSYLLGLVFWVSFFCVLPWDSSPLSKSKFE